jgi:hypothetical protein
MNLPERFDVAISFAQPQRPLAEALANIVRKAGFVVFYDAYYQADLWGAELPIIFDEIYRKRSRYCVIFKSREYAARMWTNVERRSAVARAIEDRGLAYVLPVDVDEAELPGIPPTIGHLALDKHTIEDIAQFLVAKLSSGSPDSLPNAMLAHPAVGQSFERLHQDASRSNGMAGLVIGSVPEGTQPLSTHARKAVQSWFTALAPRAVARQATSAGAWWTVENPPSSYVDWSGWVPGASSLCPAPVSTRSAS